LEGVKMPVHTAKSLFGQNITSAKDSLALYDAIAVLSPQQVNLDWVLRAAVVFTVSSVDAYFHDKVKYRVGKFSLENMPPLLASFEVQVHDLASWDKAKRKGNVFRNWVTEYLSTKPLQSRGAISEAMKLAGIQSLWDTIEPDRAQRESLLHDFDVLISRRNQISHEGDRLTSRRSGKVLRPISRDQVESWISFAEAFVQRIETAFPG
jgi:hypothetical protein